MKNFQEFWPFYLDQHRNPRCRALHYTGTLLALLGIGYALLLKSFWPFAFAPVVAYTCSWIGHFVFERNIPATFSYPWLSLQGDFRMLFRWMTGRLKDDLERRKQSLSPSISLGR